MKRILIILTLGGLCGVLSAPSLAGGDIGWSTIDTITQRECRPNKGLEITLTASHRNPDVCANSQTIEVDCLLPTYKQVLAMALTAQSAALEINGYVSECDGEGQAIFG